MLAFVWAEDEKGLIGANGTLPWRLPNDLKFFKEVTTGSTIVMGRKTFEGMGKRLLPNRQTIVLTREKEYDGNGAEVVYDIESILNDAQYEDIYIVGGKEVFQLFEEHVMVLYRTKIHHTFEGDTYFPENFRWENFYLVRQVEGETDEKNRYDHTFELYKRVGE